MALALALAGCGDAQAPPQEARGPAGKLTLSNPVAAVAQVRAPRGFPASERDCPGCFLRWRDLTGFDLSGADLRGADLTRADLSGADLAGVDLREADLTLADLTGANLDGARLDGAALDEAVFDGADLSGAIWADGQGCADGSIGGCVPAEEAPPGFPVSERDCPGCFLRWRDLSGSDLSGANLRGADLTRADLSGADLGGVDLREADLTVADLTGVNLDGARLDSAALDGAVFDGADLSGAIWVDGQVCANGSMGECVPAEETPLGGVLAKAVMLPAAGTDEFELAGDGQTVFRGRVTKWYGGRRAAVSITYDSAYGTWQVHSMTARMVVYRNLRMDHEIVTAFYLLPKWERLVPVLQDDLRPRGIHLFGHGHQHVNHDSLTYEEALASFRQCYAQMDAWGFRPRAYSYPHSRGHEEETQRACRDAGFICARGSTLDLDEVLLCADDELEPGNWYYLPAVSMARDFKGYINNHAQLEPLLEETEERGAWVILMYHAIGMPIGWGYYEIEEFGKDLDQIAAGDFWSANMDDAAAYVQERNAARVELKSAAPNGDVVVALEDGLDDGVFDQPLTLELEFNPDLGIGTVVVETAAGQERRVPVEGGRVRLDAVPDGKPLTLRLYPASRLTGILE